jgi:hypothetical protein
MLFGALLFIGGMLAPKQPNGGRAMPSQGNKTEDGTWEELS